MNCSSCLNDSRHPFRVGLNGHNVCYGCITQAETKKFNPGHLESLFNKIKSSGKAKQYDCIIPIRGDADDYIVVNEVLKGQLRPLLCGVNSYFLNTIGWKNIQNLQTHFDLDLVFINPNLRIYRDLVSYSLARYNDINRPYQFLLHSFVQRLALSKKIKYIIYGENQPTEQTGNFSNFDYPEKSLWFHTEFDFGGQTLEEFLGTGSNFGLKDLYFYNYPIDKINLPTGIYLSNYKPWNSLVNNLETIQFGFTPEKQSRTYDYFHRAGYSHYYEMHDFLRFKRYGYLKVRDHLNRDLRYGLISKSQACQLYTQYLLKPFDFSPFFEWLGVSDTAETWIEKHFLQEQKKETNGPLNHPVAFKKYMKRYEYPENSFCAFSKQLEIVK